MAAMSQAAPEINTLYLFDASGKQVIICAQGKLGKVNDLAEREYIKAALAGKMGYSSAPTKSIATGKLIVSVAAPIFDDKGKVIGGVGISYDIDGLTKMLGNALKPIPVDETLLEYLQQKKRLDYIKQWRTAASK